MNLLLITKDEKKHYVFIIKDFNAFMYNQSKHKERKHFCIYCLQCFSSQRILANHGNNCLTINGAQAINMPKQSENILKFNNFHKQLPVPFVIYADFEAITKKVQGCKQSGEMGKDKDRRSYTKAYNMKGGGDNMFTADSICEMIEFLIDNIFVQFGGRLFRQVIGIPMGTNCAPLLADLFLYSYENEFLDNMIRSGHRRLARSFNLCYRYIDDLIVFNNKKFLDYLKEIYPSQLTVEKANKSDHLADYLDLTFIIDSGGKLSTRLYDKRDDFDFHIVNFPFLSSNIPSGPSYGVYISQLIRYA